MTGILARLRSSDGTPLAYRRWPVDEPAAVVLIVPGYADHSGRYGAMATFLNEHGIEVYAVDLRGHGLSGGPRGYVSRFDLYLDDLHYVRKAIGVEHEDRPLFIVGHSMGGLVALQYAIHRKIFCAGLAVSCPFLGVAVKVPAAKHRLGVLMSLLIPRLALPSGINPEDLSHDPKVVNAYEDDPLVFTTATARWYTEALAAMEDTRAKADRIRVPTLFLQATDDHLADPKGARPVFEKIRIADKRYIEYPGFYHEIFNEVERARPLGDLLEWISGHRERRMDVTMRKAGRA